MSNPIPHSNLFATPILADIQAFIDALPKKDRAVASQVFMLTMNSCHSLAQQEFDRLKSQPEPELKVRWGGARDRNGGI